MSFTQKEPRIQAGADYDLQLMWTVIVAAAVAYVLQVHAATLTLSSGMSLGAAVRVHFARRLPHGIDHDTALGLSSNETADDDKAGAGADAQVDAMAVGEPDRNEADEAPIAASSSRPRAQRV